MFTKHCLECLKKKKRNTTAAVVVKAIRSYDYLSRIQIDLIDFPAYPDGEYRFILNIQDHFTKFMRNNTRKRIYIPISV